MREGDEKMAKLTDADFGKTAHVCQDCGKVFFVGLSGVKHNCPACGGKLLVRELTRADTHREKDERSM
jgi:predicted RNA-binding Zn-ribbon protein involved in translation (DUF1610 family)